MADVFIEPRPKGSGPIQNFVVEEHADQPCTRPLKPRRQRLLGSKPRTLAPNREGPEHQQGNPDHWRSA
jgi:hypothetical protein